MDNYIAHFEKTVCKYGDKTAIVDLDGKRQTTYKELFELERRVAGKIRAYQFKPGTPVIIYMGRCMEYTAAFLGILTAGCSVVPLVREYPEERVNYIKYNCNAELIITEEFFADVMKYEPAESVCMTEETPAYYVYTSGSTGNPKGIVHTNKSFDRMTIGETDIFDIGEPLVTAMSNSFSFLLTIYSLWRLLLLGATIHIISGDICPDAIRLAEYYDHHHINLGFITAQMIKSFRPTSGNLKRIICGGEPVRNSFSKDFEIINVYGASETGLTFGFKVDKKYPNTPIGKPFSDCEAFVSPNGELCVIGDFSKEYIGLPDKTKATFECRDDGRVLYHTGDVVSVDNDGKYTFLNRIDWMVKINGQRVETLEIESVLDSLKGIKNAAVKAFTDEDEQNYLCAYYVPDGNTKDLLISESKIREGLNKKLPPYMIPRFFVKMDELPKTVSGKVNRVALDPPSLDIYKAGYVEPANDNEALLCRAFSEVLKCGKVGALDDFVMLGGDSIKAIRLSGVIEESGYSLKTIDILKERTPKRIALCLVVKAKAKITKKDYLSDGRCPLNEAQRGVFFECVSAPDSTMYNIPFAIKLPENVNINKFMDSVQTVVNNHPIFSVRFEVNNGEPVMIMGQKPEKVCILSEAEDYEKALKGFVRPFDIEKGPLYRFELYKTNNGVIFLMDVHHLIFDGTSLRVFLDQVIDVYERKETEGEKLSLFDAAEAEIDLKESDKYKEAQAFFENELSGVEYEMNLIPDIGNVNPTLREEMLNIKTPSEIRPEVMSDLAGKMGVTESTLFMAAFAYTLGLFGGTKEVCFTTVNSGRHDNELMNTIGMFVKTLPMHFTVDDKIGIEAFLSEIQDKFYKTMEHDVISFGELVNKYGVHGRTSFVYQSELLSGIDIEGEYAHAEAIPVGECQADLLLMALRSGDGYNLQMQYMADLYSEGMIKSFLDTMIMVLKGMLVSETLEEIPLISSYGRDFTDRINRTEKPYDLSITVNELFDESVRNYAENTALVYRDKKYTYSEVDKITERIAAYILEKGVGKDEFVAILTPRNDETYLAAWGVIRSGAAFESLDPTYPADRLNYMVSDSRAKLLIADRSLRPVLNEYTGDVLFTDEFVSLKEPSGKNGQGYTADPDSAITMIYTSGTTGKPKGCVLENRNLVAFYYNHREVMELDCDSKIASYASFGFDAGIMDIITTALCGGTLCIVPDEIRLDYAGLEDFYCKNKITHGFMTTQVGRMFAEQTKCTSLKVFTVGGEKLVPFKPQKGFRFVNGYGPCETMAYICHYDVKDNNPIQPIGKPSNNTKLYVMDASGRLLPPGAIGELGISGYQVGRGYLNLPEMTEKVFVKNPYDKAAGYERIYKTGDIVRLLSDGNLEYIGRRDHQVKIRGFRIELTEVEEVIRRFGGITDATVAAFDDMAGGKYLAAYIVSNDVIDIEKLNSFIRAEKPEYMVPAVTMQIDAIPYTQNQKVNKRALPMPSASSASEEYEKPVDDCEQKIYDLAADVLGHSNFGTTTDLFKAGMTSIGILKFNMELGKEYNKPFSIADIKKHGTVKSLAKLIGANSDMTEHPEIEKKTVDGTSFPLTDNQMGVFLDARSGNDPLRYNIPVLFKISDKVDTSRLLTSIIKVIDAHPYMKTSLDIDENGNPVLNKRDGIEAKAEMINIDHIPDTDKIVRPFNLIGGDLYRAVIYITKDGNYLFIDVHHIISDGMSIGILIRDINKAYLGEPVDEEKMDGYEIASGSVETATAEEYYEKLLEGVNTESLPGKCPEIITEEDKKAGTVILKYSEGSERILKYLEDNKLSANAYFNVAFGYTLSRFIHSDDVAYCTVYNGRSDSRYADTVAMLVKTLPVRFVLPEEGSIHEVVSDMQGQLIDTMSNDAYSFLKISEKYGLRPDIFFNYQGDNFNFNEIGNEKAETIEIDIDQLKAPFSMEMVLDNGIFVSKMTYARNLFCKELAESFSESVRSVASEMTIKEKLGRVSLFSESEKTHFDKMNNTDKFYEQVGAESFISEWAGRTPEKIAVKTATGSLTYSELNTKARILAGGLIERGVRTGEIIGLILDRSEIVPICELGILKAGAAFLPMLPTYPDDRLEYCINDAEVRFVITTEDILESKEELFANKPFKALLVNDLFKETDKPESFNETGTVTYEADRAAYCIYTSGSTGTPKGVLIEQHNLSNFIQTSGLVDVEKKGTAILAMASISFDMSITEIFFSLCHGNTVYIASEDEIHNVDRLCGAIIENGIDIMMMTPSLAWSLLSLDDGKKALSNLTAIVLGAEAFQPSLYNKLKSLNPDMCVMNGYGPTECTQVCSSKVLSTGENVTIGGPFANTRFNVIDESGNLLPRYAVGELMIGGEGVARGYVNLPDKTADAFTYLDGVRTYHSGDLVRINRDMEAEFAGRADNQVKLRGFRIELDEIETVMQEFDGINESKVIVRNNGGEDFLAGFFTAGKEVSVEDLAAYMKSKLTYYMVPSALMQLDKMPMTVNGKLDKKALPEIKPIKKKHAGKAPKQSLEGRIVDLFKEILNLDECYADDNFFEIGGTSLSASKAVMRLKSDGYPIEYQDIFDHQSAEELAEYLEVNIKSGNADKLEDGSDKHVGENDYISELLSKNVLEYASQVERKPLGTVLLTGATGFLGCHILKALLEYEDGKIICLLRKGNYPDIITRLKASLVYYFEDDCSKEFDERISVVEGDITEDSLVDKFDGIDFDTLINCAASVKHFANDDSIEYVNVHGVENLIELSCKKNAKMIQISTTSIPGAHNSETYRNNLRMTEDKLFVIDDMNNQYGRSKYHAELKMLNAIRSGMRGKIIRVGNLMGRHSDGEFQTNMHTNAFLNGLRGFVNIGKFPISHSTDPMSFSPVDCVAKAVVLLSGTNDMFTAFHAESRAFFDEMKIFEAVNRCGLTVAPVSDEEYYNDFYRIMGDNKENEKVSALLTNDRPDVHMVECDNRFSANILYRLGFSWPFIDDSYLEKVIRSLDELDFFNLD